jgi:hypothetical protein
VTRANSITLACQACGKPFKIRPSALARGRGTFCSRPCAYANRPRRPTIDKFWSRVAKGADDECWFWTGTLVRGYGHITEKRGQWVYAHRFSYELAYGPIPDGLFVCHNCPGGDARNCVNPAHLWLGSPADNIRDMDAKGRRAHGERAGGAKLTDEKVRAIRQRYAAGGVTHRGLAKEYGVSQSLIQGIVLGKTWR